MESKHPSKNIHGKVLGDPCDPSDSSPCRCSKKLKKTSLSKSLDLATVPVSEPAAGPITRADSVVGPIPLENSSSSKKIELEKLPHGKNAEPKKPAHSSNSKESGSMKPRSKLPYRRNVELKKPAQVSIKVEESGPMKPREKLPPRRNVELKKAEAEMKKPEAVPVSDGMPEDDVKNKREVGAEAKKPEAVQVSDGSMHDDGVKNEREVDAEAKVTEVRDFDLDLNVLPPNWDHHFI